MIPSVFLSTINADLRKREGEPISTILDSNSHRNMRESHSAPARWTNADSDTDNCSRSGWRKFGECIFGHAPQIGSLIGRMEGSKWMIVVNIFYSILQSVSATVFILNPSSGLIILTMMLIYTEKAAILGLVSLCFGIFSSIWPLRLPMHLLIGGSMTFNCFLLGSSLMSLVGKETYSWQDVAFLIPLAAILGTFVIYLYCGLSGVLSRIDVLVLSAPTNLLALLLYYSGYLQVAYGSSELSDKPQDILLHNMSINYKADLPACSCSISDQIWSGTVLSLGIIYQIGGILQSYIIYLCVFIYSPILFCQEILGAFIGTVIGIGLEVNGPCGTDICNGLWGYNSLLTAGALGGFFVRFNVHSFLLSIMGAVLSGFLCAVLKKSGIPVLGIPFMLATWLLLPLAKVPPDSKFGCLDLQRVVKFSTPELNSFCHSKQYSRNKIQKIQNSRVVYRTDDRSAPMTGFQS